MGSAILVWCWHFKVNLFYWKLMFFLRGKKCFYKFPDAMSQTQISLFTIVDFVAWKLVIFPVVSPQHQDYGVRHVTWLVNLPCFPVQVPHAFPCNRHCFALAELKKAFSMQFVISFTLYLGSFSWGTHVNSVGLEIQILPTFPYSFCTLKHCFIIAFWILYSSLHL